MSTYNEIYVTLLDGINNTEEIKWKAKLLATFAAPSLDDDDKVKTLLTQNRDNIEKLPMLLSGSLFDYKNEVSNLTDIQTDIQIEEETNVNSTEFSNAISVSGTGY